MNLNELLANTAQRCPQKTAFVEEATEVSYAALTERIDALAKKLTTLALAPGSRVGLCFNNGVHYVALTYALWKINAIVVPVPTECPPEELKEIAVTMELAAILSQKPLAGARRLAREFRQARRNSRTSRPRS